MYKKDIEKLKDLELKIKIKRQYKSEKARIYCLDRYKNDEQFRKSIKENNSRYLNDIEHPERNQRHLEKNKEGRKNRGKQYIRDYMRKYRTENRNNINQKEKDYNKNYRKNNKNRKRDDNKNTDLNLDITCLKKYKVFIITCKINLKSYIGITSENTSNRVLSSILSKLKNNDIVGNMNFNKDLMIFGKENFKCKFLYSFDSKEEANLCSYLFRYYLYNKQLLYGEPRFKAISNNTIVKAVEFVIKENKLI